MRKKADGAVEECPSLEHIITIETGGLDEIKAYGTTVSDEELDERIDSVKKTDLCSIVYTSGSTAAPKGVEMTHEHYCQTALNLPAYMPDLLHDKRNTILLFLPQAHSFARAINYIVVSSNVRIYIATGIKTLISDLQVAKPTLMIVVPRVLEKVYNAASQKAGHGPKGVVFASAVVAAQNYMKEVSANGKAGALTRTRRAAFDPIVYSCCAKCSAVAAKWIVAGGAPLDPELLAFFRGAGVPVYEGYGLTETTAPCAFSRWVRRSTLVPWASHSPDSPCASPRTAKFRSRVVPCSRAITRTTRPLSCRSPKMAGMSPATWAVSTTMASCTSPVVRRI